MKKEGQFADVGLRLRMSRHFRVPRLCWLLPGWMMPQPWGAGAWRRKTLWLSSQKLNRYQLNSSVTEKEALALILPSQDFDVYLGLAPLVYTDHNPPTFLRSGQNPFYFISLAGNFIQACWRLKHAAPD